MKSLLITAIRLLTFYLSAQPGTDVPLGDLFMARKGKLIQYSSADPSGGNNDKRPILMGESLTLHTGPVSFGMVKLKKGANEIGIELIDKDVRSAGFGDGYLVGIDGFLLYD